MRAVLSLGNGISLTNEKYFFVYHQVQKSAETLIFLFSHIRSLQRSMMCCLAASKKAFLNILWITFVISLFLTRG